MNRVPSPSPSGDRGSDSGIDISSGIGVGSGVGVGSGAIVSSGAGAGAGLGSGVGVDGEPGREPASELPGASGTVRAFGTATSVGRPKTAETTLSPSAVTTQVETSPAGSHAPPHRRNRAPSSGTARSAIASPGLTRRAHDVCTPPQARRSPVTIPRSAGRTTTDATVPRERFPFIQSRSTGPSMPAIRPAADHCQIV